MSKNPFSDSGSRNIHDLINDKNAFFSSFKESLDKTEEKNRSRTGPDLQWIKEFDRVETTFTPHIGVPHLTKALSDFDSGMVLLAGQSNAGKTSFMIQCMMDMIRDPYNTDIVVVDISLDDPFPKRFEQFIANRTGLTYSKIHQLGSLFGEELDIYEKAKEDLLEYVASGVFWPFSAYQDIKKGDKIFNVSIGNYPSLEAMMYAFRDKYPSKKIVFFLDAWQDIDLATDSIDEIDAYIKKVKQLADKLEIKLFGSAHFKKIPANTMPSPEDIRGSKELVYSASCILVLRNDYKENAGEECLLYTENEQSCPLIRIEIPKNKTSAEDRTCFYALLSGTCKIIPMNYHNYIKYSNIWRELVAERKKAANSRKR